MFTPTLRSDVQALSDSGLLLFRVSLCLHLSAQAGGQSATLARGGKKDGGEREREKKREKEREKGEKEREKKRAAFL